MIHKGLKQGISKPQRYAIFRIQLKIPNDIFRDKLFISHTDEAFYHLIQIITVKPFKSRMPQNSVIIIKKSYFYAVCQNTIIFCLFGLFKLQQIRFHLSGRRFLIFCAVQFPRPFIFNDKLIRNRIHSSLKNPPSAL